MIGASTRWYVVQTHPHAEAKAASHLARQGFTVYLPRYSKRRHHARKVETIAAPLFPRYLFVAVDMVTRRWRAIRSTVGVAHLLCRGDEPASVCGDVVAELRRRENDRGLVRLRAVPAFAAGDRIRIADGAFSDCLGLVEGMNDSERVAVLLDLLGRKVRVVIGAEAIEAA
jgi:transcriptional antiterminator RfaH